MLWMGFHFMWMKGNFSRFWGQMVPGKQQPFLFLLLHFQKHQVKLPSQDMISRKIQARSDKILGLFFKIQALIKISRQKKIYGSTVYYTAYIPLGLFFP